MAANLDDLLNQLRLNNQLLTRIADTGEGKGRAKKPPGETKTEEDKEKDKEKKKAEKEAEKKAEKTRQARRAVAIEAGVGLTDPFKPRGLVALEAAQASVAAFAGPQAAQAASNLTGITAERFVQQKTNRDLAGILTGLGEAGVSVDKGFAAELAKQLDVKNKIIEENLKIGKAAQDETGGITESVVSIIARLGSAATKLVEAGDALKGGAASKGSSSTDPSGGG